MTNTQTIKNYSILSRESECRDRHHAPWLEDSTLLKYPFSQNLSTNTTPIKIPEGFAENNKLILNFIWKFKDPEITKTNLRNKVEELNHHLLQDITMKLQSRQEAVA